MDLDGRTRQFFSVLSERLKEKGFSSRIADDGCLAVKSKKMRGKEQTQCSVGKDGEVYCRSVDFANISRKRDLESILETVNEVHSDMEPPEAPEQESTQGGITLRYKVSTDDLVKLKRIRKAAEQGEFDILLVFMYDRLGRNLNETPFIAEWFTKKGIHVWSVYEGEIIDGVDAERMLDYIRFWQTDEAQKL